MMTSFAFILGLLPLVVASGASQLARRDVGTPVFGGMVLASFVGIFAIPPLYVMFQAIRERLRPSSRPSEQAKPSADSAAPSRLTVPPVGALLEESPINPARTVHIDNISFSDHPSEHQS